MYILALIYFCKATKKCENFEPAFDINTQRNTRYHELQCQSSRDVSILLTTTATTTVEYPDVHIDDKQGNNITLSS